MGAHFVSCAHPVRVLKLLVISASLSLPPAGYGQTGSNAPFNLRGEVLNSPLDATLQVELVNTSHEGLPASTYVTGNGSFELDSVRPGDYLLRLTDQYGDKIYDRPVTVAGPYDDLTIRLPRQHVERPVSGTVSVRELQHKIAPKALTEYRKGVRDSQKQHFDKAMVHFQKAIAIEPSFADAHNELGASLWVLKQTDQAVAEFRKASELDPDSPLMVFNLGLAMLVRGQYPEAEAAARAALRGDPNLIEAHFVLGYSLYKQKRNDLESVENLQWAGKKFPRAHLLAAAILTRLTRKSEAAGELQKYLGSSDTVADRHQVESWLSDLLGRSPESSRGGLQNVRTPARAENAIP